MLRVVNCLCSCALREIGSSDLVGRSLQTLFSGVVAAVRRNGWMESGCRSTRVRKQGCLGDGLQG